MQNKFIFFLLFAIGSYFSEIHSQVTRVTIIDELETFVPGEGLIKIISDQQITALIGLLSPETSLGEDSVIKINGFRILVFMSNDSQTARKEISEKGILIRESFSEVAVYTDYIAPNWKLLAGDFLTKEEAEVFKQQLQKAVPKLGKEMYIVPDKINIPMFKTY